MAIKKTYDVVVMGGGPGGYVAALRGRQLGLSVALVESTHLGGVCLNWGCIPTKALLRGSYFLEHLPLLSSFGIDIKEFTFDLPTLVKHSRHTAEKLASGISGLLKKNGVDVLLGTGCFKPGPQKKGQFLLGVQSSNQEETLVCAKHVVVATGAKPRRLSHINSGYWTAKEAMTPVSCPKSLLVIGAGAIGLEFASFYNSLGTKVTVVEAQENILNAEDSEISAFLRKSLEKKGIQFLTHHRVERLMEDSSDHVTGHLHCLKTGKEVVWKGEKCLLAIGVVGNTESIGLEHTAAQVEKGHIVTHQFSETSEPGLFAIGDVAGPPWLAHKASHEGIIAMEKIAGHAVHALDVLRIPGCVYTNPQVASVGLTEENAQQRFGIENIKVGRFPFVGNGQALAYQESQGLVKTIFHRQTGELLGAHMVGYNVSELIHGFVIAKTLEGTDKDLETVIFPHPTFSEMLHEAVLSADGRALHI